jgi:hypothetical protein
MEVFILPEEIVGRGSDAAAQFPTARIVRGNPVYAATPRATWIVCVALTVHTYQ